MLADHFSCQEFFSLFLIPVFQWQDMDTGSRLKQFREQANLTQQELADMSGYSRNHVRKCENGSASPTIDCLRACVTACGKTLSEFFESKTPVSYRSPRDQDLHDKLQDILECPRKWSEAIAANIEAIFQICQIDKYRSKERSGTDGGPAHASHRAE